MAYTDPHLTLVHFGGSSQGCQPFNWFQLSLRVCAAGLRIPLLGDFCSTGFRANEFFADLTVQFRASVCGVFYWVLVFRLRVFGASSKASRSLEDFFM